MLLNYYANCDAHSLLFRHLKNQADQRDLSYLFLEEVSSSVTPTIRLLETSFSLVESFRYVTTGSPQFLVLSSRFSRCNRLTALFMRTDLHRLASGSSILLSLPAEIFSKRRRSSLARYLAEIIVGLLLRITRSSSNLILASETRQRNNKLHTCEIRNFIS